MFCNKYKEQISVLEKENESLKAKVVKGQQTVNKVNAYYKAKIAEIKTGIQRTRRKPRAPKEDRGSTI